MKERVIAYDYIRIVAMFLVVACHCFGDVSGTSPIITSLLSYLEAPCNGLFFAVSGALLLPVLTPPDQSSTFIIKRLTKVIIPTVFWSLLYLSIKGKLNFVSVCSIPFFPQGAGIFWFMYTLIGVYLIAPIISPWLERTDKKTLQVYLGLWAVALCYPIFKNWLPLNDNMEGPLYYLSGYVGYFVLGYYLKRFDIGFNQSILFYIVAFTIMAIVKLYANYINLYDGFWNLTVFCAVSVIFYWKVLAAISSHIKLSRNARHYLTTTSNLIFGVYFIHYGIKEYFIPQFDCINNLPYLFGYLIRIIIVFGCALILSWIISYFPFAKYIIGYKHK